MAVLGRNDVCPCGSGKKYKKCCIDKGKLNFEDPKKSIYLEEIKNLDTNTIISRLKYYGIDFNIDEFKENLDHYYSAANLSDNWYQKYHITAEGREEDFIWMATWVLWNRLTDSKNCDEELDEKIEAGYNMLRVNNHEEACSIWLDVWENFRNRIEKEGHNSLKELNRVFESDLFLSNWVSNLEMNLHDLGLENKDYFKKQIKFCREFLNLLPESKDYLIQAISKAEAAAYINLGETEKGDKKFEKLLKKYSNWTWGYIYWGDQYDYLDDSAANKKKSEQIYKLALQNSDIEMIEDIYILKDIIKEVINH